MTLSLPLLICSLRYPPFIVCHLFILTVFLMIFCSALNTIDTVESLSPSYCILRSVNSILINEQHGFCPERSTSSYNMTFCKYIFDSFRANSQVVSFYTNFVKAFDSVNRSPLISLLSTSRYVNPLLSWLHSYLAPSPLFLLLPRVISKKAISLFCFSQFL